MSGGAEPGAEPVVVLRHQLDAGPGNLADWLADRGLPVRIVDVPEGLPDDGAAPAGRALVVLGSAESVARRSASWIDRELTFLRTCVDAGLPVLGICFGAQLLAEALGGRVERLDAPEIGWIDVRGAAPTGGTWFSWHHDRVTPPPGAEALADTARCVQAFRLGRHVGVQFHPETTAAIVADWTAPATCTELDRATADGLVAQSPQHLAGARRRAHRLYDWFFDQVARECTTVF